MRVGIVAAASAALLVACSSTSAQPIATVAVTPPAATTATAIAAQGGGQPGFAPPTTGTIQSVDGSSLVLKTTNGSTMTLALKDQTAVRKMVKATKADLQDGTNVSARGSADAQGKITATSLQILPAGQNGFGGGQRGQGNGDGGQRANGQGNGQASGAAPNATPGAGSRPSANGTPGAGNRPAANGTPGADNRPGANGTPGARRGNGNGPGGVAFGTIQSLSGDQLTLKSPNGNTVTVTVPDSATIEKVTTGAKTDLQSGQTVSVVAPQNGPARAITIEAAA